MNEIAVGGAAVRFHPRPLDEVDYPVVLLAHGSAKDRTEEPDARIGLMAWRPMRVRWTAQRQWLRP